MRLIGLAGSLGVGKDTIADYLVAERGFLKFSFSDALYQEVSHAFDVDIRFLKDRLTKEEPTNLLALSNCRDEGFILAMDELHRAGHPHAPHGDALTEHSPREILQLWGTDYRRGQDPEYWVIRADDLVGEFLESRQVYDKHGAVVGYNDAPGLVNASVRFPNERALFSRRGGEIWHVYRPGHYTGLRESYVSELTLPIETGDRILINNSNPDRLGTAADLMLRGNHVVSSQVSSDGAFVPVFVPRTTDSVAEHRARASTMAETAPTLGEVYEEYAL